MSRPRVANPFRLFSLVVLLAVAWPAAALAGAVQQLTTNDASETGTDAAIDVSGNVHVVYERSGSLYYRGRTGTTWSTEELVAAGTNPAVGAGASGVPQVAFLSGGGIWFTARVGGTWMAPVQIGSGSSVDLAVDGNDVGHVVYLGNYFGDGYSDIVYTNNSGGAFPISPIKTWNGWYMNWGGGSGDGNYFYAPVIAADAVGHYAIGYRYMWWSRYPGGTDWATSLHVYRSATDDDVASADWYKGTYPDLRNNGVALAGSGAVYAVYGSTLATVSGTTWTTSTLPAGSSHTLATSPAPALHVAYVDASGGINYAEDTGAGFGTPLVLDPTTTGRNPVVIAQTDPFVAYEAVDSGDYEVWFARTTNQAPVLDAIGDKSVDEGTNLSFTLSATDGDGDDLTYGASNLPTGATFTPATRAFSWTPAFDQAGSYTAVVFSVTDGTANVSESITIAVNQVNAPPVLGAIGNKSVDEAAAVSFTLSATDMDGDALTYGASNLPTGAAFDPGTATFSWTPGYDQAGTHAAIVFTVTDNGLPNLSDSETISITVNDVNRPPVLGAIGDRSVDEAATLSFTVSATDADGDALTYGASNLPTGATFNPATATFSWTPGYDQAGSYAAVVFTVTDSKATDSESITITANDVNAPPVLGAIGNMSVDETSTLTFTVSATDVDGNALIYGASNLPTGATFNPATATFSWTPDYDQAGTYAAVVFNVTDDGLPILNDSETITITVNDVNRPPALGAIGDKSVDEAATLSFTVSATDGDGNGLTYGASNLPAGATFNPATATFSWTPGYDQAGSHAAVVFTVTDDGVPNRSDSESITITVNDVNAPPVLTAIGDRSVNEAATLTFTVSATDVDGNALTYSASNLPTGASFDPGTRTFSWTPGYDQAGPYTNVTFQVTDDGTPNLSDSESITVTVDNVNRAPVLDVIGDRSVMEGDTLSFTVSATDADGDTLTYAASNLPTGATFDPGTRTFSWTPGYDQAGSYPAVVFDVADAETTDSESITITVSDNPTPPGFFTVVPCRVLDTRNPGGPLGGPALVAGTDRTFTIAGQCDIPTTASAVSVNLTVTAAGAAGNLRLYPAGTPLPLVSTINYTPGATRANNAIVSLSDLGEMAVRCSQASGTVHFILDVNGYFQPDTRQ